MKSTKQEEQSYFEQRYLPSSTSSISTIALSGISNFCVHEHTPLVQLSGRVVLLQYWLFGMSIGCESGGEGGNVNDMPSIVASKEILPTATVLKIKTLQYILIIVLNIDFIYYYALFLYYVYL